MSPLLRFQYRQTWLDSAVLLGNSLEQYKPHNVWRLLTQCANPWIRFSKSRWEQQLSVTKMLRKLLFKGKYTVPMCPLHFAGVPSFQSPKLGTLDPKWRIMAVLAMCWLQDVSKEEEQEQTALPHEKRLEIAGRKLRHDGSQVPDLFSNVALLDLIKWAHWANPSHITALTLTLVTPRLPPWTVRALQMHLIWISQIFTDFHWFWMIWMPSGVRDHEMAGTMDVASLLQDIQSKQDWEQIKSELSDKARRGTLHHLESFIDATDVGIEEPNRKCLKQLWKAQQEEDKQEIKEPEGTREEHLLLSMCSERFGTIPKDSERVFVWIFSRPVVQELVKMLQQGQREQKPHNKFFSETKHDTTQCNAEKYNIL